MNLIEAKKEDHHEGGRISYQDMLLQEMREIAQIAGIRATRNLRILLNTLQQLQYIDECDARSLLNAATTRRFIQRLRA